MRRFSIKLRPLFPFLLLPALAGCSLFSAPSHYRGTAVSANQLKQLTPGVSTEADATALLGSPTLREAFDHHNWLYVSQVTKRRIGETQGVIGQHVVMLDFGSNGVLKSIHQVGKKQAVRVAMAGGRTRAPGGHAGFLQELIGGVGHYNPGLGAGSSGGFGGSNGISGF